MRLVKQPIKVIGDMPAPIAVQKQPEQDRKRDYAKPRNKNRRFRGNRNNNRRAA